MKEGKNIPLLTNKQGICFRAIVLGTLLVFGAIFATFPRPLSVQPDHVSHQGTASQKADQQSNQVVGSEVLMGFSPEAWTAIGTVVLAFVTAMLFVATLLLYRATGRLVRDAKETSRRQLRAYVGLEDVRVVERNGKGGATRLSVKIRNFGQIPASNCKIGLAWTDQRKGHGVKPEDIRAHAYNPATLMPGGVEEIGRLHTLATLLTDSIVVGSITYDDGFGASRYTNFKLVSRLGSDGFGREDYGNESD